jgi:hypothetical protein
MRSGLIASIILVLATAGALAQNPPANSGPNNKAVNSKSENNPALQWRALTVSLKAKPNLVSNRTAIAT